MLLYFLIFYRLLEGGTIDRPMAFYSTSYLMAGSIAVFFACLLFSNLLPAFIAGFVFYEACVAQVMALNYEYGPDGDDD